MGLTRWISQTAWILPTKIKRKYWQICDITFPFKVPPLMMIIVSCCHYHGNLDRVERIHVNALPWLTKDDLLSKQTIGTCIWSRSLPSLVNVGIQLHFYGQLVRQDATEFTPLLGHTKMLPLDMKKEKVFLFFMDGWIMSIVWCSCRRRVVPLIRPWDFGQCWSSWDTRSCLLSRGSSSSRPCLPFHLQDQRDEEMAG